MDQIFPHLDWYLFCVDSTGISNLFDPQFKHSTLAPELVHLRLTLNSLVPSILDRLFGHVIFFGNISSSMGNTDLPSQKITKPRQSLTGRPRYTRAETGN